MSHGQPGHDMPVWSRVTVIPDNFDSLAPRRPRIRVLVTGPGVRHHDHSEWQN